MDGNVSLFVLNISNSKANLSPERKSKKFCIIKDFLKTSLYHIAVQSAIFKQKLAIHTRLVYIYIQFPKAMD